MKESIKIGTRGSALALAQTNSIAKRLREQYPNLLFEIVTIKTTGDKMQDVQLAKIGGKGVFVKEIEDALLRGDVRMAVHSMKDVPSEIPEGLHIGIIPEREDPRDVLIAKDKRKLEDLLGGARIGTGSLRRGMQLRHHRPDVEVIAIRGNLDTRIKKIDREGLDGIIVAAAGVNRMGWTERVSQFIPVEIMLPAIGQGALAIELRRDDDELRALLCFLDHKDSRREVRAERAFLKVFGGGCQLPIAAYGKKKGEEVILSGLVGNPDGTVVIRDRVAGPISEGEALGRELAERILAKGGRKILEEVYCKA